MFYKVAEFIINLQIRKLLYYILTFIKK